MTDPKHLNGNVLSSKRQCG